MIGRWSVDGWSIVGLWLVDGRSMVGQWSVDGGLWSVNGR